MGIYSVYATLTDLATYLETTVDLLPLGSSRLLKRASELIQQTTQSNIRISMPSHMEALKLATCAQVEYWNEIGENNALSSGMKSFSNGDISITMQKEYNVLGNRATTYLNQQHLLYRGIKQKHLTNYYPDNNLNEDGL